MSDIVKRLRDGCVHCGPCEQCVLVEEQAADEIERLRGEVETARTTLEGQIHITDMLDIDLRFARQRIAELEGVVGREIDHHNERLWQHAARSEHDRVEYHTERRNVLLAKKTGGGDG